MNKQDVINRMFASRAAVLESEAKARAEIPPGCCVVPSEVLDLYNFMNAAYTPMTPQQEQIKIQLDIARKAMALRAA
jgi:hypothetical protein